MDSNRSVCPRLSWKLPYGRPRNHISSFWPAFSDVFSHFPMDFFGEPFQSLPLWDWKKFKKFGPYTKRSTNTTWYSNRSTTNTTRNTANKSPFTSTATITITNSTITNKNTTTTRTATPLQSKLNLAFFWIYKTIFGRNRSWTEIVRDLKWK